MTSKGMSMGGCLADQFRKLEKRLRRIEKALGVRPPWDEAPQRMAEAKVDALTSDEVTERLRGNHDRHDDRPLDFATQSKEIRFMLTNSNGECERVSWTYEHYVNTHGSFRLPKSELAAEARDDLAQKMGFISFSDLDLNYAEAQRYFHFVTSYGDVDDDAGEVDSVAFARFRIEAHRFRKEEMNASSEEWALLERGIPEETYAFSSEREFFYDIMPDMLKGVERELLKRPLSFLERSHTRYLFRRNYLNLRKIILGDREGREARTASALEALALAHRSPLTVLGQHRFGKNDSLPFLNANSFWQANQKGYSYYSFGGNEFDFLHQDLSLVRRLIARIQADGELSACLFDSKATKQK